jgi:hypothetical protein
MLTYRRVRVENKVLKNIFKKIARIKSPLFASLGFSLKTGAFP